MGIRFVYIVPLLLAALVFALWSWFDFQAATVATNRLVLTETKVRAEVLQGNIDKHRQGAVLLARHPAVVSIARNDFADENLRELPRLVALTDVDGVVMYRTDRQLLAIEPSHSVAIFDPSVLQAPAWQLAITGGLGRYWTPSRYYFLAPVFVDGRVAAVAISHFSMVEATAQLSLSNHDIWIEDVAGVQVFENRSFDHDRAVVDFQLNELRANVFIVPQNALGVSDWAVEPALRHWSR